MKVKRLRVLLLEDSAADAELVERELARAGWEVVAERVDTEDGFVRALTAFGPTVVLSDHALAQFNAPAALGVLRRLRPATPLIVVAGALREEAAVACMRAGAEDLVLKSNLSRLAPAIEAALRVRERLEKLSPRQLQVLGLVAEGHTTREIAARLQLSAKTVETHRAQVMKRLGLHDVVSLVRYAVRVGLVPPGT
jgi:DNA-binding NarL/FixJ family response regulator